MRSTNELVIQHPAARWQGAWRTLAEGVDVSTRIDALNEGATVACVDCETDRPLEFVEQTEPTICIAVYITGCGGIELDDGRLVDIRPNSVVLLAGGRATTARHWHESGQRHSVVDIRFSRAFIDRVGGCASFGSIVNPTGTPPIQDHPIELFSFEASARLVDTAMQIRDCTLQPSPARKLYLTAKSLELLALVLHNLDQTKDDTQPFSQSDIHKILQARDILKTQFYKPWTIAALSQETGLSETKLKTGFRKVVGNSIRAHLLDVRINAACLLLTEGRGVTDTAYEAGFASTSHFTTTFRRLRGLTPTEYKKQFAR